MLNISTFSVYCQTFLRRIILFLKTFAGTLILIISCGWRAASTNSLFKANISTKLTAENSGFNERITAGTFTIGNATFTIDENTTLSSLIADINKNEEAQATAYWDDATGKLSITSKIEGASYINIEAGTSNFTDVMGFTTTEFDENGNVKIGHVIDEGSKNSFVYSSSKLVATIGLEDVVIFMDASSTVAHLIPFMSQFKGIMTTF